MTDKKDTILHKRPPPSTPQRQIDALTPPTTPPSELWEPRPSGIQPPQPHEPIHITNLVTNTFNYMKETLTTLHTKLYDKFRSMGTLEDPFGIYSPTRGRGSVNASVGGKQDVGTQTPEMRSISPDSRKEEYPYRAVATRVSPTRKPVHAISPVFVTGEGMESVEGIWEEIGEEVVKEPVRGRGMRKRRSGSVGAKGEDEEEAIVLG